MKAFALAATSVLGLILAGCAAAGTSGGHLDTASMIISGDTQVARLLTGGQLAGTEGQSGKVGDYAVSVWQGCEHGAKVYCSARILNTGQGSVREMYEGFAHRAEEAGWKTEGLACEKVPEASTDENYEASRCKASSPDGTADVEIFWAFDQPSYQLRVGADEFR